MMASVLALRAPSAAFKSAV